MTGKTVWQVATTSAIQTFFAACYRVACAERCTLYSVHKAPPQITASHWHRLILPLGRSGEVKRFLPVRITVVDFADSDSVDKDFVGDDQVAAVQVRRQSSGDAEAQEGFAAPGDELFREGCRPFGAGAGADDLGFQGCLGQQCGRDLALGSQAGDDTDLAGSCSLWGRVHRAGLGYMP
jgi:hypothetical protein